MSLFAFLDYMNYENDFKNQDTTYPLSLQIGMLYPPPSPQKNQHSFPQ